jgi:O-antigen/teichoic acid export membrane protein
MPSILRKTAVGSTVVFTMNTISMLVALIVTLTLITTLGQSDYGLLILTISAYSIVSSFLTLGFDALITTDIARYKGKGDLSAIKKLIHDYSLVELVASIALSIVVFLFADLIASTYSATIVDLVRLSSVMIFLTGMRDIFRSVLYGYSKFFLYSSTSSIEAASRLVFIYLFVIYLGQGLYGALLSYALGIAVSAFVLSVFYLKILISLRVVVASKERLLRKMFGEYGKFTPLSFLLKQFTDNIPEWIIKAFWSLDTVAIYGLANKFFVPVASIFSSVETVFLPIMSEEFGKNKKRLITLFQRATKYSFWVSCILVVPAIVTTPFVINWIAPAEYALSIPVLQVMFLSFVVLGLMNVQISAFFALKSQKHLFFSYVFRAVTLLLFSLPLAFYFGAIGMAVAGLFNLSFFAGYRFYLLKREREPITLNFRELFIVNKYDKQMISRVLRKIRSLIGLRKSTEV